MATHRIITNKSVQYNKTNLVKLLKDVMLIPDYMDKCLVNSSLIKVCGNQHNVCTFIRVRRPFFRKEQFRYFETSVQLRYEKKNQRINILG